jgi:anaerobic ribonucleoside-triphosphate reductase activating protein
MLLHALIPASHVNGPGLRAVAFFQGCDLGCRGCWNVNSHPFSGIELAVDAVAHQVLEAHRRYVLEGVTFSGGDPIQQADSLLTLIRRLQRCAPELSFGMFSGYAERELDQGRWTIWRRDLGALGKAELWRAIRAHLDFAVLGRFNYLQPGSAPLRSSRNQVLRLFSNRYSEADFEEQLVEVSLYEGGRAEVTGFPILGLPW